jgi:geranylgeranyl diphosphate synthase type I
MNFNQALATFIPRIEAELRRLMTPAEGDRDEFYGMLHYHLGWLDEELTPTQAAHGKLLRPVFSLLCCQTAGGEPEKALSAAAAIELIHNFSLIHDDIEDQSQLRRGRRTVWTIWGEAQAINAGDALFVLARNALLKLEAQGVPPQTILAAIERLDQTCLRLCRGQFLDMKFEQNMAVRQEDYLEMIEGKTAALLGCAGYLGGLIATDDQTKAQVFWELGLALGLAFQIQDDWLGIWGDEAVTGKPTADDLRRRKKSLPVVFALNNLEPDAIQFRRLYSQPVLSEAEIKEAIALLEALGAKSYTETLARCYIERAEAALAAIEAAKDNKSVLQEMAQFLIKRVY